ncbi:phage tail tape measure protein [Dickeya dadantii]|uniref:phage tail tape measure protein n=1 Tax=Dickeya dadantii TaxID=204038 RepID=UPI001CF24278|nr:phage tail tape measure protein [Dickeya dadantii]MCA7014120.1 phage tail tape measure protein [Dickeya dadantii]
MTQQVGNLIVNLEADSASFTEQVERAKKQLGTFGDSANSAAQTTADMAARQEAALKSLLEQIDPNVKAINRLDDQYAQLVSHLDAGRIDAGQFERFNGMLSQSRQQILKMTAAANDLPAALSKQELAAQKAGISIGQYRMAMRSLPAQMTDVVTQLAGGQNPFLIMIQQGGQVKDMFGGFRPMFTGLASAISPTFLAVGATAGAVTALGIAAYKGQQYLSDFNKSLVLTGGQSGQTANSLLFNAEAIASSGRSFGGAAESLNALVKAGANLGGNYKDVAASIASLSKTAGASVDDLAGTFGKITMDPEKGLAAMAEKYGNVTLRQLDYIKSLQDSGKYTEALSYANKIASDGFQEMARSVQDNMGYLERAAASVGGAFSSMWDKMLDVGKSKSLQAQLADATEQFYNLDKSLKASSAQGQQRMGLEQAREQARQLVAQLTDQLHAEQRKGDEQQRQATLQKSALTNQQHFQALADAGLTKEQQRTDEYLRLNRYIEERKKLNQALSQEEIAQIKKGIEERYKDPKQREYKAPAGDTEQEKALAELTALESQLRVLQQHSSLNDTISQQRKDLWLTESKFAVLDDASQNRKLTKQEQSLLANKDQIVALAQQKALLGDEIVAQERLNKLNDTALKYATQMSEKGAALTAGSTISDRLAQQQRAMAQLRIGWQNAGGQLSDAGYQKELAAAQAYYAKEDALRNDWLAGAKKGFAEFEDSATNVYSSVQESATSALNGLSDSLTSLVTTGSANIKQFGTSMLKMIASVINKLIVTYALQQALGWISASASASTSTATASASANSSFSGGAYSNLGFAAGGYANLGGFTGIGNKHEPAGIVHRGEFVFTKEATRRIGVGNLYNMMHGFADGGFAGGVAPNTPLASGGGLQITNNVTIQNDGSVSSSTSGNDQVSKATLRLLDDFCQKNIVKALTPGGSIWNAMKSR